MTSQPVIVPQVKSVKAEPVHYGIRTTYYVTRVTFKDKRAVTLQGEWGRREAIFFAFVQRAMDAGLTKDEALDFTISQFPEHQKKGA
jgi:hypothetical protein